MAELEKLFDPKILTDLKSFNALTGSAAGKVSVLFDKFVQTEAQMKKITVTAKDYNKNQKALNTEMKTTDATSKQLDATTAKLNQINSKQNVTLAQQKKQLQDNKSLMQARAIQNDKTSGTIDKLNARNKELRILTKQQNAETKKGSANIAKYNEEVNKNNARLDTMSDKVTKNKRNVGDYTNSIVQASRQIKAMGKETKSLEKEQRKVNTKTDAGKKKHAELTKKITKNKEAIKSQTQALKEQKASMGGLESKMGAMPPAFGAATAGASRFLVMLKMLAKNPLIIALTLIVAVVAILYKSFTRLQGGTDAISRKTAGLSAIFAVFADRLGHFAIAIINVFKNPLDSLKTFGAAIKTNIINRFDGIIEAAGNVSGIMSKLFKGEFKAAKEEAKALGQNIIQIQTGLNEMQQSNIINFFKGLNEEISEEARLAAELEGRLQAVADQEIEWIVTKAKLLSTIAKGRSMLAEESMELKNKMDLIDEMIIAQEKAIEGDREIAAERVAILKAQIGLGESLREDYKGLADAEAALIDIQTQGFMKMAKLNKQKASLNKRLLTDALYIIQAEGEGVKAGGERNVQIQARLLKKGEITLVEYNARKKEIINQSTQEALQLEIDALEEQYNALAVSVENRSMLDKEIARRKTQLEKQITAEIVAEVQNRASLNKELLTNALYVIQAEGEAVKAGGEKKAQIQAELLKKGEITLVQYNARKNEIINRSTQEALQLEIDALEEQYNALAFNAESRAILDKEIASRKTQLEKQITTEIVAEAQKRASLQQKQLQNSQKEIDNAAKREIILTQNKYKAGIINTEQYEQRLVDIAIDASDKKIAVQIAFLNDQLKSLDKNSVEYIAIVKQRDALQLQLAEDANNAEIDSDLKALEKKREIQEALINLTKQTADAVFAIWAAMSAKRIEDLNIQKEDELLRLDETTNSRIEAAGKDKDAVTRIEQESANQRAAIESSFQKEIAAEKVKQAKRDKAHALFSIAIETAINVIKLLAEGPFGVLSALAIAAGAVAAGVVLAQPLPTYASGVEDAPGGVAIVGEEGPELVTTKKGDKYLTGDKPHLMNVEKGSNILPHKDTKRELISMQNQPDTDTIMGFDTPDLRDTIIKKSDINIRPVIDRKQDTNKLENIIKESNDKLIKTIRNKKEFTIIPSRKKIIEREGAFYKEYLNTKITN